LHKLLYFFGYFFHGTLSYVLILDRATF
jgi:hypothetical protein